MNEQNPHSDSLQDVKDIKRLMERSSRFISLSGLSGISAGISALAGAAIARYVVLKNYYDGDRSPGFFTAPDFRELKFNYWDWPLAFLSLPSYWLSFSPGENRQPRVFPCGTIRPVVCSGIWLFRW